MIELVDHGAVSALRGEGADMRFQQHGFVPRTSAPVRRAPAISGMVDHLAGTEHIVRLKGRCRIRHVDFIVDPEAVVGARFDPGNLAVMDADGANIQTLWAGHSAAWAPSDDVIAFVGCCDSLPQLYLARLNGVPVKLPIQGVDGANHPAWSPDGLRIAFECFVAPASNDLCIVNKDGTGLVRLWITDFPGQGATRPAWSPDGRTIAFTTAPLGPAQIAVIPADGSRIRFLADGIEPAWSRDSARLVFAGGDGLFVIGADGSNLKRLTTGHHGAPAWRP